MSWALWLMWACSPSGATDGPATPAPVAKAEEAPLRVVALGDVHGDLAAARRALRLAGVVDASNHWSGGRTVVVQVGDQLDRGDDEREILDWFERLREEAGAAGGAFYPLLGNHEVMNVAGDLRYVTPGGFEDFAEFAESADADVPAKARGRVAAFRPGGPYAKRLSTHRVSVMVEGTVFVHGGLLFEHTWYGLDRINAETAAWMRGEAAFPPILQGPDAPIWTRRYSSDTDAEDCAALERTLAELGAKRMVVAHTVQEQGINAGCDGKVWRVDVGMARHYGGQPAALEIIGDEVRVITESSDPK
jgi:hypothetical protein